MNTKTQTRLIAIFVVVVLAFSVLGSMFLGAHDKPLERVSERGRLQVIGTQLCGEDGKPIVLRGMSTSGYMWHPSLFEPLAVQELAERTGANLLRVAMYTGEGGYLRNPWQADKMYAAMDAAIENDLYVIIDWHILSEHNPMPLLDRAKEFFTATAERYADSPNVLYEICNEPNGDNVTWAGEVKPYAEQIIPVIREYDPNAVILVGSPRWSTCVRDAADDPLEFENVMYTYHFYAGTNGDADRDNIDYALAHGAPVFVSEWGTTDSTGAGALYLDSAQVWVDFMEERNLSWANWSYSASGGSGALLSVYSDGRWKETSLSESGKFVFAQFHR